MVDVWKNLLEDSKDYYPIQKDCFLSEISEADNSIRGVNLRSIFLFRAK
jgi:hypothetical protein